LPDSKAGAKIVPLAVSAIDILSGSHRNGSPYVLPALKGEGHFVGIQKVWEKVRARGTELLRRRANENGEAGELVRGLETVRLHDLRHSFASMAIADGATLYLVGKVLGHKQSRTTEIYAHVRDDPLRQVTERTAAQISAAMKAYAAT